ncbi:MAG: response regulator transcription factor [Clostridia bacterium]|nr:response regulator transcription factor [Clostridia bacterium]
MDKKRILIIEDERNISQLISFNLTQAGYECDTAADGETGLEKALTASPDLILLDIMLPKVDGFTICKEVRKVSSVPIIMVTAREEEVDKIVGLNIGADDYVTKPFSMKVLMARIAANLRRVGLDSEGLEPPKSDSVIVIRSIEIDCDRFTVRKNGELIELSKKQFELLVFLASNLGHVYSREELLNKVWGYDGFLGDIHTVDVTINRLRTKIEDESDKPQYILTRHGRGYYME